MILIWGYVKNDLHDCSNEALIMSITINIVSDKFVKCMYVMLLTGSNFATTDLLSP